MTTVDDAQGTTPVADAAHGGDQPGHRRQQRRVWLALGGAMIIAAAGGFGVWMWVSNSSTEAESATAGPAETAVVELGTVTATESWDGTLDRGIPFTVASSAEGMVTWIADQGQTVGRGDELYRVNEQPATLMFGVVPMYRDLGPGDSGADVRQLETNLEALGYDGFAVDREYGPRTADAVRAWQADVGVEQTGTVARSDVVFVPERGQIDAIRSDVGEVVQPGRSILDITGTNQVVSLEADVDDRDLFEVDTAVTLVLPGDDDEVAGTVSATSVIEVVSESPDGEGAADTDPILQVEIAVEEEAPDEFIGTTIEVIVAIDERTDVLWVPVNALLAPAEGGYGLELVGDDGTTSIVNVETGLFADGRVEIRSDDIAEGVVVGAAGR